MACEGSSETWLMSFGGFNLFFLSLLPLSLEIELVVVSCRSKVVS